jgi:hypothetical protein
MIYSTFNTSSSVPVRSGFNIAITAALSGFSANGVNFPVSTATPLYLDNAPLLISGELTNLATGTIFYYYTSSNA